VALGVVYIDGLLRLRRGLGAHGLLALRRGPRAIGTSLHSCSDGRNASFGMAIDIHFEAKGHRIIHFHYLQKKEVPNS
jgi:hypothetical protein